MKAFEFMVDDKVVSKEECTRLAEADNVDACNRMGLFYDVHEENFFEAVVWYKRAAHLGYAPAQGNLGSMYEKGRGVPRDPVLAYMWYSVETDGGLDWHEGAMAELEEDMSSDEISEARRLAREKYR